MTVADLVFIDETGYHYADFPTFLAYIQGFFQSIYGPDIYLGADSQDGQLTAVYAQSLFDTAALGAQLYSAFSPTTAMGVGLSMNVKINGLQRQIPTNSTAILTIVGVAGTQITNGIAVDSLNQQWALPSSVTIPGGGSINVTATAVVQGAVLAAASTITGIFTPTLGWQTVNNAAPATSGVAVETDAVLRARQAASVANPSVTVFDGTIGAVENVEGVVKTQGYENFTSATDGNGLPPHSICIVVEGGDITAVATQIMLHKTPGTDPFAPAGAGFQSVALVDPAGMPITIDFYSPPDQAEVLVQIIGTQLIGWSSDFVADIQDAVAAFINGLAIGGVIYPAQLYAPAFLNGIPEGQTYNITSLEIKFTGGSFGTSPLTPAFNAVPFCVAASDVSVTIT